MLLDTQPSNKAGNINLVSSLPLGPMASPPWAVQATHIGAVALLILVAHSGQHSGGAFPYVADSPVAQGRG